MQGIRLEEHALQVCRTPGGKTLSLQPLPHLAAANIDSTLSVARAGKNCTALSVPASHSERYWAGEGS